MEVGDEITRVLSFLKEKFVFLWMSRLHPDKGADLFIDALGLLRIQNRNICGVIAGPDECGLLKKLRKRAQDAGLSQNLIFLNTLSGADKIAILRRAQCFVLPTLSEGFSMAILEALAAGCSVITTHGAHFPEIVPAGAGKIVSRDALAISEAMISIAGAPPDSVAKMGENGVALVKSEFSWRSIARKYEQILTSLV
jgi:glycosyltransferase involved in cell wall biosynthesis